MNYSKSIKKTSIAKRVLISWLIVAFVFFFTGFIIGSLASHCSDKTATKPDTEKESENLIYVKCDGKNGIPQEWISQIARKDWIKDLCDTFESEFSKQVNL